MALRTRNAVLAVKVEGTPGTYDAPAAATDAVIVDACEVTPQPQVIDSTEERGGLDAGDPIIGAVPMQMTVTVGLRGASAVGTAPEYDALLKACGFVRIDQAAIASGTTLTGTSTSTFTVDTATDTSWPNTNDALVGAPVTLSGNPATPETVFITRYKVSGSVATATVSKTFGAALDGTTDADVPQCVLYHLSSALPPSISAQRWRDGIVWRLKGVRGDCGITLTSGGRGALEFTMRGQLHAKADDSLPSIPNDPPRPPRWADGDFFLDGAVAAVQAFSVGLQNQLVEPDDPNATEGIQPAEIISRSVQGSANPQEELIATRDIFSAFKASTDMRIAAALGSTAGNRIAVVVGRALARNESQTDRGGILAKDVPFSALGSNAEVLGLAFY